MIRSSLFLACLLTLTSCSRTSLKEGEVVIYCALDSVFAEPVLNQFEQDTGIRVRVKFDAEASKTTGLTQALLAEKSHPRCDVYWNNEIMQTLRLKSAGVLSPYDTPSAKGIPDRWKDPEHQWTAIAARARVIVYNPDKVATSDLPQHVEELSGAAWKDRLVIAKPLFGTTATHLSILYAHWGTDRARTWLRQLKKNGVAITDGNASVVRLVAGGERDIGLTDTDDVFMALQAGRNIAWALIGQDAQTPGPLMIPNTVALIQNGPNVENGKKLIDYLVSAAVEETLSRCDSRQIPLHAGVPRPDSVPEFDPAPADFSAAADLMPAVFEDLKRDFL